MISLSVYFKVLKKHMLQMLIYLVAFLSFVALEITFHKFEGAVNHLKIIIQDEDQTNFSSGLITYLEKNAEIIQKDKANQNLEQALYFGAADCIVKIPKGFTELQQSDEPLLIQIESIENSGDKSQLVNAIDTYCRGENLGTQDKEETETEGFKLNIYFNYLIYGLGAVILIGVMDTMRVLNVPETKMRRLCAPITSWQEISSVLKCHLIFGVISLMTFIAGAGLIDLKNLLSLKGVLWSLNSLWLVIILVEMGYLFSMFASKAEHQVMITNVVTLGTNFLSGNYVRQSSLDAQVIALSKFLPTYWYIRSNNCIVNIKQGETGILNDVWQHFYIEGVFIVLLLVIILVISKEKARNRIS